MALLSPVLCFVIDMWRRPRQLWSFLAKSTALYGALGPLSSIGVVLFGLTKRAVFHVTADKTSRHTFEATEPVHASAASTRAVYLNRVGTELRHFAMRSHPDHVLVQGLEIAIGAALVTLACATVQLPFLGLAMAYLMLPLLHHLTWEARGVQVLVQIPFFLIVTGVTLGSLSIIGVQTVFFGYGFHF